MIAMLTQLMALPFSTYIATAVLFAFLAALAWIDTKSFRLPNALTLPLILLGLLYQLWWTGQVWPYLLGAALGYLAFWLIEIAYKAMRKQDGLGRGDAKLLAAGGAWCGALALPFIVLMATAAALAWVIGSGQIKSKTLRLPFGPFLAFGIAVIWIAGFFVAYP